MSIEISSYQDRLWCDVVNMDVAHILLGRSWLYDLDVSRFGKSKTYEFKFNGKKIVLKPAKPKSSVGSQKEGDVHR